MHGAGLSDGSLDRECLFESPYRIGGEPDHASGLKVRDATGLEPSIDGGRADAKPFGQLLFREVHFRHGNPTSVVTRSPQDNAGNHHGAGCDVRSDVGTNNNAPQ